MSFPLTGQYPSNYSRIQSFYRKLVADGKNNMTGHRKNQYEIGPMIFKTTKETQLTNTVTLDDSPEYKPGRQMDLILIQ